MNFEDLQKTWQSWDPGAKVSVDADVLLKEVRRNQRQFRARIFWRDVREVVVISFLVFFFLSRGLRNHDWTDILLAAGCFFVCSFFIVDRLLQRKKRPAANDPLKACIQTSLHEVSHQIWLLKNVFWWYLLPVVSALAVSLFVSLWEARHNGAWAVIHWIIAILVCILVYWGVYWINQYAVRKSLQPRRQELEKLLAGLE